MIRYLHLALAVTFGLVQLILTWFGGLFLVSHFDAPNYFAGIAFLFAAYSLAWPMFLYGVMNSAHRRMQKELQAYRNREETNQEKKDYI